MPFGLKNVGANYQGPVNAMFKDQIRKMMEAYVEDMLEETFAILKEYQMKQNPSKCTFEVSLGKFIGYMVLIREIDTDPANVHAFLEMKSSRTRRRYRV